MASGNETEPPPANQEDSPKKGSTFLIRVFLWLGALQVYNIVTRQQDLLNLSQSIHLIVDWWRWVISQPFIFIGIKIPLIQREVIAVFLFFSAAANLAWYRATGVHFVVGYLSLNRYALNIESRRKYRAAIIKILNDRKFIGSMIIISILLMSMFGSNSLAWLIACAVFGISLVAYLVFYQTKNKTLFLTCFVVLIPALGLICLCAAIMYYWKEIAGTLRYLLIVLVADVLAKFAIDPLLSKWPELPHPPPLPF